MADYLEYPDPNRQYSLEDLETLSNNRMSAIEEDRDFLHIDDELHESGSITSTFLISYGGPTEYIEATYTIDGGLQHASHEMYWGEVQASIPIDNYHDQRAFVEELVNERIYAHQTGLTELSASQEFQEAYQPAYDTQAMNSYSYRM